jgi:hypothetical protein
MLDEGENTDVNAKNDINYRENVKVISLEK